MPDPEKRELVEEVARLRRKLELLTAVAEGTTDAVFAKDLEGRYLLMNSAAMEFIGRPEAEILGKDDTDLFPADVARALMEADRRIRDGGEPVTFEEPMVIDGRKTIWLSMKAPFYDDTGGVAGTIGIARDISALRETEEARHQLELQTQLHGAQKLESLGVLAGGIAHDFNNILVGVLGNADLGLAELPPASPTRVWLERIKVAARGAADLCREMLAYSGKGRFVIERIDLNELAREMHPLLQASISKTTRLRLELAPGLFAIEADVTQIRQVILNLITNASEALEEGSGEIVLATRAGECDRTYLDTAALDEQLPEGDYVSLEVSDSGCGMDHETRDKMFDPFFTTKFSGRGLGLAAVQGIVRGHRGTLRVDSEPGKGTTFEILLPLVDGPAEVDSSRDSGAAPWTGSGTVLLVDDEEVVRTVGGEMLRRLGFSVLTAKEGSEAVRLFHGRRAAAVLCPEVPQLPAPNFSAVMRQSE